MKKLLLLMLTITSLVIVLSPVGKADETLVLYLSFDEGKGEIVKDSSQYQ